jgi:hypothetical protein
MTISKVRSGVFSVLIVVFMASCNRFEDGPSFSLMSAKARLTGDWEVIDFVGPESEYFIDELSGGLQFFLEFEKNGEGQFGYGDDGYQYSNSMDWELDENELTLTFSNTSEGQTWEIQRLTNKELEMQLKGAGFDIMTWVFEKTD